MEILIFLSQENLSSQASMTLKPDLSDVEFILRLYSLQEIPWIKTVQA